LQKGMELKVEDRWQNMNELYAALDAAAPDAVPVREIAHKQQTAAKTEATVLNHSSPGQANASVEDSGVSMKTSEMKAQKGLSKVLVIATICVAVIFGYFIMSGRKNPAVSKPAASQTEITSQSATSNSPMPTGFTEVGELKDLNTASVGDHVIFGSFEQDNTMANGKEPIEWLVLVKDENRILVISRYALDCQQYNTSRTEITWETSSLRKWLNETFLNAAFSKEEQARIPSVTVIADKNPRYSANPGNDTTDQVFLLSILEAEEYFSSAEVRKCAPTDYAMDRGVGTSDSEKVDGRAACFYWWLRSPGKYQDYAAIVFTDGSLGNYHTRVDYGDGAVRPALWINQESDTFKNPEEESEQDNIPLSDIASSTVKETDSNLKIGSTVTFGSYEQDNNVENGTEPIEWLVLAKDENRILIISRYALDCQQYNTSRKNVTWETCSLRKWLNETFFNVAFSKEEQERIPNVTVSTDKNTSSGKNSGNSTTDQVFLLSILEAKNYFSSAEVRKCAPTDYAVAQGVRTSDSYKVNGRTACWWWLRSLGKDQISAASVYVSGSIYDSGNYFDVSSIAVRPALWLNYES